MPGSGLLLVCEQQIKIHCLSINIGTVGFPKTYEEAPGYCGINFWLTVIQLLLDAYFRKNA